MKKIALLSTLLGATLAVALHVAPAQAQATRTWVSGVGDDVNPCSRTAPCKTFAGAISKTAVGGIINCIDPGGFGAVTITKSIMIDCTNTFAGILAAGTNGVVINGAGIIVTLRGLSIEGVGTGLIGVNFINGSVLRIEKCNITGFRAGAATGVSFVPPVGVAGELYISDAYISDNGSAATNGGIVIRAVTTGNAKVVLDNVRLTNNSTGIRVDGTGSTAGVRVVVRDSVVAGSTNTGITALSPVGGAPVAVFLDRVASVKNATTGVVADGAPTFVFLSNSTFVGNTTGISFINGASLLSYTNNNVNGNLVADGDPSAALVQK